jgi:hypothetical protein
MLRYVKEMCTVGLKCPHHQCVAEVTKPELAELFSAAFVKIEMSRIETARLLEADAMYLPDAKLAQLPLVRRLLELAKEMERAVTVRDEMSQRCFTKTVDAMRVFCTGSGVAFDPAKFWKSSEYSALRCFSGVSTCQGAATKVCRFDASVVLQTLRRFTTDVNGVEYTNQADSDVLRYIHDAFGGNSRLNANKWRDFQLQFSMFHAALSCYFTTTVDYASNIMRREDKTESVRRHTLDVTSDDNLKMSAELFAAFHEEEPSVLRVIALYDFHDLLQKVLLKESIAVARTAEPSRFPAGDEASYSNPYLYTTHRYDSSTLPALFNFRADSAGAAGKKARAFNCCAAGCKGVFSSLDGTCTTCATSVCVDCHVPKLAGESHACMQSDKDSVQAIHASTKPCPTCLAAVYKSSGCDQMMCTLCHAMFLYTTGELVKRSSALHNPHYLALPRNAQEAVRRNLANQAGGADAGDAESLACVRLDNPRFHLEFYNTLVDTSAAMLLQHPTAATSNKAIVAQMRYWERTQQGIVTSRTTLVESERLDRLPRLQFLVNSTLPVLVCKDHGLSPRYRVDDNRGPLFAPMKPFGQKEYVKRLAIQSGVRQRQRAALSEKQAVCDLAHELLVSLATEETPEGRTILLNALVQLRVDFVSKKRKREDDTNAADAGVAAAD